MTMADIKIHSHHDILRQRQEQFEAALHRGEFYPLLLKHVVCTFLLLLIPLVIPHRNNAPLSRLLRYGFFSIIACVCVYMIYTVRVIGLANGYGVGLICAWFVVWSATLLIFNDAQRDFKRIVKKVVDVRARQQDKNRPQLNGSEPMEKDDGVHANGSELRLRRTKPSSNQEEISGTEKRIVYRWQPFPNSLGHRIEWALDLVFNFRGPEWNWRVRSLPAPPYTVIKDLGGEVPGSEVEDSQATTQDPWTRLRLCFYSMLRNYIALDIVKVLMNRDPYFWGLVDRSPPLPPPLHFHFLAFSPVLVRFYRVLLSLIGVYSALQHVTSYNPLFFLGLSLVFPRLSRAVTDQPLDEAWLYPEQFGPMISVLDNGLAGCWSGWWHQIFRVGFSETGRFLSDLLVPPSRGSSEKSHRKHIRRAIQVVVAFSVSGLLHAFGSYTQFATTKPRGPFLFFLLQAPAIMMQGYLSRTVVPRLLPFEPPRWLRRATNLAFVVAWFVLTGPLIVDDLSRGGIWLFEPVPVSPLRGMGFGTKDDGWLCWKGPYFQWWEGGSWWQKGIRIV